MDPETRKPPSGLEGMPTGELVNRLAAQVSELVRGELELARTELTAKGKRVGAGAGLAGAGGVVALYGLGALIAAAIAALALVWPVWLAALVVGVVVLVVAGVAWMTVVTSLLTAAQMVAPAWVRGRALAAWLLAFQLGLSIKQAQSAVSTIMNAYRAFRDCDATMLEINPLVVAKDDRVVALDAKMSFDGNAIFRHDDVKALRDESEEDAKEIEASKWDLAYVALDGNIGCMVNGAGLAMATMDIIKLYGKEPANFCDVGGGAGKEKVAAAFKIITADPKVEGILVNIFGGIMKCDVIADGIVSAAKDVNLSVPLVVRLEGTNVEHGKAILANSGLPIVAADDLGDAARKIVAEVKQAA